MQPPIYMDNHATTRVDPRVVDAMLPFFTESFGNAASRSHVFGRNAQEAVDVARRHIAKIMGAARVDEIVFTSGGTESNNLALKGVMRASRDRGDHIVTQKTEHSSVLDTCRKLERDGYRVTYLDVDALGRVNPEDVRAAITDRTVLVSIMVVNNEVGTVQDIVQIGRITRERDVLLHCDAVQALGRVPFDVESMQVDLASASAHKLCGPKGVGALYVRRSGGVRARLQAQLDGGGHESGLRSGTLNVPGIVGLGRAAEILIDEASEETARISRLRDRLRQRLSDALDEIRINGAEPPQRHPGNLNVSFGYVSGDALMLALERHVAVSSGSACSSGSDRPTHVLEAIGLPNELASASLRFGIGRFNTEEEVDRVADVVIAEVRRLRDASPLYELHKTGASPSSIKW